MLDTEDLEDEIDIDLVVFDLDGTIADTANLFEKDVRRLPYDVLRYSDHSSVSTPLVKIPGLRKICNDLIQCGVRVAIITNSPRAYASTLCFLLGIDFDVLIAANTQTETSTKVQKLKWMSMVNSFNPGETIEPSRILYVGDRLDDESAAHAAGCQFEWAPTQSLSPDSQLLRLANRCSTVVRSGFQEVTSVDTDRYQTFHNQYIEDRNSDFECFGDSGVIGYVIDPNGPLVSADHWVVTFNSEFDDVDEWKDAWMNGPGDVIRGVLNSLEPHSAFQRPIISPVFVTRYDYDHQPEVKAQMFKVLNKTFEAVRIGGHLIRPELREIDIFSHFKWSTNRIAHDLWKQVKNWSNFSAGSEVELLNLEFVSLCMAASISAHVTNAVIVPMPSSTFSEAKPGRVSNRLAKRISELLDFPYVEVFNKDDEDQVGAMRDIFPFTSKAILIDDQITNGNLALKCAEIMQLLNVENFEIRSWSASRFHPMPPNLQSSASQKEQLTNESVVNELPRVGRRVHTQRCGIGIITKVGEFYIEVNFKQKGVELLSLDDVQLDYLD